MSLLNTALVLVTMTVFVNCDGSSNGVTVKDISDFIKYFELCDIKCNGIICECCEKIGAPLNVEGDTYWCIQKALFCGSSSLRVAEKSTDLTLKVDGEIMATTNVKLDSLLNFTIPVETKGGKLGINVITSLAEDKSSFTAIDVCITVYVSVEGVNFVRAGLNCAKFDGDIEIEGETSKGLKTYGYVKVVNGDELAKLVKKIVTGM